MSPQGHRGGSRMAPQAAGVRLEYAALPVAVRDWVESALGSRVVSAHTQSGGFSPGCAARLLTAHGARAFVKAVGEQVNERSAELHRWEIRAMRSIPSLAQAPGLLASFDSDGWVGLLQEDVEGRFPDWSLPEDRAAVFDAIDALSEALDPSPWAGAPRAEVKSQEFLTRWSAVRSSCPDDLDPWLSRRLDWLVAQGDRALQAITGDALCHWDIRADNVLITPARSVVFVDWAHACLSRPWVNYLGPAMDVLEYADPEPLLVGHANIRLADPAHVTAFIAAVCGGLTWAARQPDPAGLPTIRAWQRHQADLLTGWLRRRTEGCAHV